MKENVLVTKKYTVKCEMGMEHHIDNLLSADSGFYKFFYNTSDISIMFELYFYWKMSLWPLSQDQIC